MSNTVCRTCFKVLQNKSQFTTIDSNDEPSDRINIKTKLEVCVPELKLEHVKKSVMCYNCVESLNAAYEFKAMCMKIETNIAKYVEQMQVESIVLNVITKNVIEGNGSGNQDTVSLPIPNKIRCLACKQWFTSIDEFRKHMNTAKCDYQAGTKGILKRHLEMYEPGKSFQCLNCDYKTTQKNLYDEHCKTHSASKVRRLKGKRLLKCEQCSFTSYTLLNYQMHVKTHDLDMFSCKYCSYTTVKQINLNKHVSRNHRMINKQKGVVFNGDTFQFTMEHIAFILENDNVEELLKQPGKENTDDFESYLVTEDDMLKVLKNTDAKIYFENNEANGVFPCPVCKSSFKYQYMLNKHLLKHNDGTQPFKCTKCGFSDTRKGSFKLHMMMHMGKKVYECDVCSYRTIYLSTFQKHQSRHQQKDMERCQELPIYDEELDGQLHVNEMPPFRCGECLFESNDEEEMKTHLDMHILSNEFIAGSIHQHFLPPELII
ncbi:hypothetical protein RN001_010704 [Aquatica leii]|uniref:C2H2-type domain-containing protein n=1 Tax=Aquatica leii TaxID=1421715 RepID=A0AAN7P866_9COLE|nr:hypothetical protein RN001_010704 [Aquatica leii]